MTTEPTPETIREALELAAETLRADVYNRAADIIEQHIDTLAAAPLLLEALKELVRLAEGNDHEAYHAAFVEAKGAIALAEGRIR